MHKNLKNRRGPELSQRQLRVGEEVRHILSSHLQHGFPLDETLQDTSVTITEVRMSADLKHAFAFVMPLGGDKLNEVVEALNRVRPMLRTHLSKIMRLKFVPNLHFEADKSFEVASHINKILHSSHVSQDLSDK